jgi:hypothetical protein
MSPESTQPAAGNGPLALAENGRTRYKIISATDGDEAIRFAVRELGTFLSRISGATFPVAWDDAPPSPFEIVIGPTNRLGLHDLPEDLQPRAWEGFAIVRDGPRLVILGRLPRATLYGVYDFLDVELGVRFLTPDVTHVPSQPTLTADVPSRRFDPVFEYRCVFSGFDELWTVRNRMNANKAGIPMESMLGGVRWAGKFVHTLYALVPAEEHFDAHPEFFALIEGERRREWDGGFDDYAPAPCMSNPDLPAVAAEKLRQWIDETPKDPHSKYLVSVTINDSPHFCQCDTCVAINKEEGVQEGGTKMRFVNAIAEILAPDYPNVAVETMLYHTQLPKKTRPVSNVLLRLVYDPDWRYDIDDASCKRNQVAKEYFREVQQATSGSGVYNWVKHVDFPDWLFLMPNLRHFASMFRAMSGFGVTGLFCQNQATRDAQFQNIRYYLLARAMWRPQEDSRDTIREFCSLYYGPAAESVQRYIDFLHDEYGHSEQRRELSNPTVWYDDRFIETAESMLDAAEDQASDAEQRQRVGVLRLPVWKMILDRACPRVGKIFTFPREWSFRIDPENKGWQEGWAATSDFTDWRTMAIDKHWTLQGEAHRGVAWYGTHFDLSDTGGASLAIFCEAIDGFADIVLDGVKIAEQKLGHWAMWRQGFFRPLPRDAAPGRHTLLIRVDKSFLNAGIWRPIHIIDMSAPLAPELRRTAKRFLEVARASKLTEVGEKAGPIEENYYPKIEYFLTHGA